MHKNTELENITQFQLLVRQSTRVVFLLAFSLTALTNLCFGQTYSAGYNKYVQGDFEGAEKSFEITLSQNLGNAEKARIYKMLGITQYMQGKRIAAEASFKNAKNLNSFIEISPSEVLDESVVSFFNAIESDPRQALKTKTMNEEPKNETFLKIYSTPSYANIAIDGVQLGRIDRLIKVSPGYHDIEVSARNYRTQQQAVDVKAGQVNHVSINLSRKQKQRPSAQEPPPITKRAPPLPEKTTKIVESTQKKKTDKRERVKRVRKKGKISKSKPSRRQSRKKRRRQNRNVDSQSTRTTKMSPVLFLPFGAGQFINDDVGLGVASGAFQLASLLFAIQQWQEAETIIARTDKEIKERDELRPQISDPDLFKKDLSEAVAYQTSRQLEVDALYQNSIIASGVFGLLWIGSTIQAYLEFNSNASNLSLLIDERPRMASLSYANPEEVNWPSEASQPWSLGVVPGLNRRELNSAPSLNFSVELKSRF